MPSPLQNRVLPNGDIVASSARGIFMGNRGGRIHDSATRTLHPTRRWASRQWICCVLDFKQRQRKVMGESYTELFFLDEVTALASGHRPCFECRRADAKRFAAAWPKTGSHPPSAPEMDLALHEERLDGRIKRTDTLEWKRMPVGAITEIDGTFVAKHKCGPLKWSATGYEHYGAIQPRLTVSCLTPPRIRSILDNGYGPVWHPSANQPAE